jgi:hypothetical protein
MTAIVRTPSSETATQRASGWVVQRGAALDRIAAQDAGAVGPCGVKEAAIDPSAEVPFGASHLLPWHPGSVSAADAAAGKAVDWASRMHTTAEGVVSDR